MDAPPPTKPSEPLNYAPLWVAGGAAALFVSCAFTLFILLTRTGPLVERLVSEARAREGAPWPRPSHGTPPVPGTFAEALTPLMADLESLPELAPPPHASPHIDSASDEESQAYSDAYDALTEQCSAVSAGETPLREAPLACIEQVLESREAIHRVLAATRAEVGGLPANLGGLAQPADMLDPSRMNYLQRVVELAALEIQLLRAEGRPEEAVDTCMDALALSRELSLGGAMYGRQLSAICHDTLLLPCAEALDSAPLERQRLAVEQLARLRQGYPPLSAVLRDESVYQQLSTYGDLVAAVAFDKLPPMSQELVAPGESWEYSYYTYYAYSPGFSARLRPYAWRHNAAVFDEMVAVADLPPEQRRKAFEDIDARHGSLPGELRWSAKDYGEEAEQFSAQPLQALALAALVEVDLVRAEQGRWPETLSPELEEAFWLIPESDFEASLVPRLVPRAESLGVKELRLTADTLPAPHEEGPASAYVEGGALR